MDYLDRITTDPAVMSGKPCIRGTQITVVSILDLLAAGSTTTDILKAHPRIEMEDIGACLQYAAGGDEDGLAPMPVAR